MCPSRVLDRTRQQQPRRFEKQRERRDSRKPALLKPKPSRGSKETRAFDRVEPRIADIDRVFHRGLQPVRGGFSNEPARIHPSILESGVRRASSQRRLRVRGGAWESHPGSLGFFRGLVRFRFPAARPYGQTVTRRPRKRHTRSRLKTFPNASTQGVKDFRGP